MPTIEVVPLAKPTPAAPGWAYVLESVAPDPSKQALAPRAAGKRSAARSATDALLGAHAKTQAGRLRARLDELARDGGGGGGGGARAPEVDVPAVVRREVNEGRWKITRGAGRGVGGGAAALGRQTQNVKRVLASTKTWAHHATDEEVRLQALSGADEPREGTGLEAREARQEVGGGVLEDGEELQLSAEERTLLRMEVPQYPSKEVIESLLSTPPLTYTAAATPPSKLTAPARKFCDMCGHWGKLKCTVCGSHVCSLSCKVTHDATEHPHR
jgi:zinc finger HIT domain-containing protein 1